MRQEVGRWLGPLVLGIVLLMGGCMANPLIATLPEQSATPTKTPRPPATATLPPSATPLATETPRATPSPFPTATLANSPTVLALATATFEPSATVTPPATATASPAPAPTRPVVPPTLTRIPASPTAPPAAAPPTPRPTQAPPTVPAPPPPTATPPTLPFAGTLVRWEPNCGGTQVKGRVTDAAGNPLAGVIVRVLLFGEQYGAPPVTDGGGEYDFARFGVANPTAPIDYAITVIDGSGNPLSNTIYLTTGADNCDNGAGRQVATVNFVRR